MSTEQELVALAREGDQEAFAQLVRDNERRVYHLALRMLGSPEDAEEAAQEAFLSAWRSLPTFKAESTFSTWLYRLTSNLCIDIIRKEKRRREIVSIHSLDDDEDGSAIQVADLRFDPEREAIHHELQEALTRGLDALSPEHRRILTLRELGGLSYDEIGKLLRLEAGTVKSRIARARLQLRNFLAADGNFSPSGPSKKDRKE